MIVNVLGEVFNLNSLIATEMYLNYMKKRGMNSFLQLLIDFFFVSKTQSFHNDIDQIGKCGFYFFEK